MVAPFYSRLKSWSSELEDPCFAADAPSTAVVYVNSPLDYVGAADYGGFLLGRIVLHCPKQCVELTG